MIFGFKKTLVGWIWCGIFLFSLGACQTTSLPTSTRLPLELQANREPNAVQVQSGVSSSPQVFFGPFAQRHQEFIDLIGQAKTSVHLVMFRITNKDDVAALIAAAQRKVEVRVILDGVSLKGTRTQSIRETLESQGVQVKASSKAFSITHEKAMTIDGEIAMISTANLTNALKISREIGVVVRDPEVITEFDRIFEADWQNADNDGQITPSLTSKKLIWSPVNAQTSLLSLIDSAQKTIEVYVENFTSTAIGRALATAAKRGVKVRVITPLCDENINRLLNIPMTRWLNQNGVEARMMGFPSSARLPYIHAKAIVVDEKMFYVGSINFSTNSLAKAREVGLILTEENVSTKIVRVFNGDWSLTQLPPENTEGLCGTGLGTDISKSLNK